MDKGILINAMDPALVKIYQIKDIEEISFTDMAPSTRGSKFTVMPNLLVTYDGGKYLSMCSQDKYFDIFVKKVFQVYNLEKNREIVDPTFDPFGNRTKLKIDERTKSILESGDLTKINEIYSFYDKKKSYNHSLIFQSDELKMLLPMVKYHLKQIFDCTDRVITLEDDAINGYRNNYSINYKLDGIDDMLIINFVSHNNNESCLYIRSRDNHFKPLEMVIRFNDTSIDVNTYFKDYALLSCNTYEVKRDNSIINTFRVSKDGQPIIYKNFALDRVDNPVPNVTGLDSKDDAVWYKLPWNAMYGANNRIEALSEVDEVVNVHNKYLAIVGNEFMGREYASQEYRRKKTFEANANRVVMEELTKRTYGVLLDPKEGIYVIETYFANELRSNGYYDTYLDDRYFYHLAQNKNYLLGLNTSDLVSISSDNNIIRSADLLVMDDVKSLLRR